MNELYDLTDGWEWKTLGEVGKITTGNTPSKKESKFWDNGEYLFVKPPHLGSDIPISDTEEKLTNEGFLKAKPIPKNSIMVCCIGSLGKIGIADKELATNQQINAITFYEEIVDFKYGYYFATTLKNKMNLMANKAVVAIINKSTFSTIQFPLPPLQEQKRIVSKLDTLFEKIDKAIALHQKNMDEVDVFMGSVLNEVFGELKGKYKKQKINEISTVKGGKRVPKGFKLLEEKTPYPYLRVTDFKNYGTISKEKMLYLSKEIYEKIKRYTITDEDLYITNVGNTIGKSGIIPSDLNGANLTENAVKLVYKDKENTSNKFMYYFTKSSTFILQMESAIKQMAVPKLAIMRLGEIVAPFPPLNIQQKTVNYLDQLSEKTEKVKSVQKEKMESLKALKASLLDRAFRGEL